MAVFNVIDYGADPTGAYDSTTAINAAITDARTVSAPRIVGGGTILFPVPGNYKFSSILNLNNATFLNFEGPSHGNATPSVAAPTAAANLIYTGTTDPSAISLQSAKGITFKNLGIQWSDSGFKGYLVDCRQLSSSSPETTNIVFEDCILTGTLSSVYPFCAALLILDGCQSIQCVRTSFYGGIYNVIGIDINGQKYSSAVLFNGCHFQDASTCAIQLPDQAWKFVACTFEPLLNGAAGAITCYDDNDIAHPGGGVDIEACWIGDDQGMGTWIDWYGYGLGVHGCAIGVNSNTTFINIRTNACYGILVEGNSFFGVGGFSTIINFGTTTEHTGFVLLGNSYTQISTIIGGTIPTGSVYETYFGAILDSPTITTGFSGDNLTLQSAIYPNLLSAIQADFETSGSLTGWDPNTAASLAITTAAAKFGTHSLAVTATSVVTIEMSINMIQGSAPYYSLIPVQPNTYYTALAYFLCASGYLPRQIQIEMHGYDSSGYPGYIGTIGKSYAHPGVRDNTSTWTQLSVTAFTPSNCAYIGLVIRWTDTSLSVGEVHYLDGVQIAQGYSLVWQLPGTTPVTIAAGPAAGTSPTVSLGANSNTNAGTITITTGSSPAPNDVVAQVNFTTLYSVPPKVISLTPINGNAATSGVWADSAWTESYFKLKVGSTALSAATIYIFGYVVIG